MSSLNERAWALVEELLPDSDELGITLQRLDCGSRVIDLGVRAPGGLSAGLAMARVGMAGLGEARINLDELDGNPWPWVVVRSDRPLAACYLSQAAHWPVQAGSFRAMGSGPACLLNRSIDPGKKFGYREAAGKAVLVLESSNLPDDVVCRQLAAACGVDPAGLAVLVAPTSSLAGSAQIAARSIETAIHKLAQLGFDPGKIISGIGRCPLAAPTGDALTALGRTNDMMMFGSQVWLALRGVDEAGLPELARRLPANASPGYGPSFLETLRAAGDFYAIDPGLFAPAEITLTSLDTGEVVHAGAVDTARLNAAKSGSPYTDHVS